LKFGAPFVSDLYKKYVKEPANKLADNIGLGKLYRTIENELGGDEGYNPID